MTGEDVEHSFTHQPDTPDNPIFEIADEGEEARVWTDPTDDEMAAVTARAWEIADAAEDVLHWGNETLRRPQ